MRKILALLVIALAALRFRHRRVGVEFPIVSRSRRRRRPGHYVGTAGDSGTIEMQVYDRTSPAATRESDHWVQHFKATVQLTVGGQSLTAALDGQFNFTTRQTVLNGVVLDGWLSGAQIHEEGKVVGFSPLTFVGTVMVMRGSAN